MPSKNDLSALKARPRGTLQAVPKSTNIETLPVEKKRVGRRPKPASEKESFTLPLKLTEAEGAILKEKAGMVPLATFVKAFIRENTELLK